MSISAEITKQQFLFKAKALATIMSPKGGINVVIEKGKHQPRTNGVTIFIPEGDWSDPVYLALVEWYIDHELGHVKKTDFTVLSKAKLNSRQRELHNCIEDVWMERETISDYPGMQCEMHTGVDYWREIGYFQKPNGSNGAFDLIRAFFLYFGRGNLNGQNVVDFAKEAEILLKEQCGHELTLSLKALANDMSNITSTLEAIQLTHAVFELLEDEASEDRCDPDDSTNDDVQEQNSEASQKEQGDELEPNDSSRPKNESEANQQKEFAKEALEGDFENQPDLHELLKAQIAEMAMKAQKEGRAGIECGGQFDPLSIVMPISSFPPIGPKGKALAAKVGPLFNQHRLTTSTQANTTLSRSGGHLDPRLLAGVPAGNFEVFESATESRNLGFELCLLVDMSISMQRDNYMEIANETAYGILSGLTPYQEVDTRCYHYPYGQGNTILETKGINDLCDINMNVPATGICTPTREAIQSVLLQLVKSLTAKSRIICIITDGKCSEEEVIAAQELASIMRVTLIGIGIGKGEVKGLGEGNFIVISEIEDLPGQLSKLIFNNFK